MGELQAIVIAAPVGALADPSFDSSINRHAQNMIEEGRKIFRYDTFGDEDFWGGQLQLHRAIVGPTGTRTSRTRRCTARACSSIRASTTRRRSRWRRRQAKCGTCHVAPLFTEPGYAMHKASEIGIDDFQANRSPDKMYRTTAASPRWMRS